MIFRSAIGQSGEFHPLHTVEEMREDLAEDKGER